MRWTDAGFSTPSKATPRRHPKGSVTASVMHRGIRVNEKSPATAITGAPAITGALSAPGDTGASPPAVASDRVDLDALLSGSNVTEVLDELDAELIGLNPVKARIRDIAALLLVE